MKSLKLVFSLLLLSISAVSFAEGKIAVINFEQAILNTDAAKAKIAELENDADYQKNIAEAKKIQEEGQKLAEKYQKEAPTMSPSQKADLETKIKARQADIQHVGKKIQEAKKQLLGKLMYDMNVKAMKAAKEIIDAEGVGLLLNGNPEIVLHADTSFDITAKVTDKLNKTK